MASLQHILAAESDDQPRNEPPTPYRTAASTSTADDPPRPELPEPAQQSVTSADVNEVLNGAESRQPHTQKEPASGTARRNMATSNTDTPAAAPNTDAKNASSSAYAATKLRHLKKEDGIPLWRRDIQYDFLKLVFYNDKRCFTKYSDKQTGFTFAEVYIDAMAKSSKCSKILKEKLLSDTDGAISMAMVCLLVNLGRMNTTLNCEP